MKEIKADCKCGHAKIMHRNNKFECAFYMITQMGADKKYNCGCTKFNNPHSDTQRK